MMTDQGTLVENAQVHRHSVFQDWITKRKWFIVFVILPTLAAAIYYSFIASDVYISESRFVVKSPDQKSSQISSLANLVQTKSLSSGQDEANEVLDYVRSRDAVRDLSKSYDLEKAFAPGYADRFSRYPGFFLRDSFESLFKFYGKRVSAQLDSETGDSIIKVEAFSPHDAYQINARLLNLSEQMVNRLNDRAQAHGVSEAEARVAQARQRVRNARIALAQYRNASNLIDPAKQATGALEVSNTLITQQATLTAQLSEMERLTPNNPSLPALRARVAALSAVVAGQERRVVGSRDGIASKLTNYEALAAEQDFATQSLNIASANLVQAQNEAVHQKFYLERIVAPNLPDEPLLPRRLWSILVVAISALCLYFIGWMLLVGILEHAPEA